ncbi:hypothetical protein NKDENANG_02055 [Candidatus Entotheonellaceae bacterium PAL068K]
MPCELPQTQLYVHLDGELAASEALPIESHLRVCETCQQESAAQQRLQILLRSTLTRKKAPQHLWPAIRRQLLGELPSTTPAFRWWRPRRLWVTVPAVVQEIVDSQIRSRLMEAPYHRIPADSGAIRRWFRDKVAFSVLVPQVAKEQYAFQGVRLNYFLVQRVAEIAYTSVCLSV